jgi:hypothetical protein
MVKVYFETGGYAKLVAIFDSEETYNACLPALEKLRKKHGIITLVIHTMSMNLWKYTLELVEKTKGKD